MRERAPFTWRCACVMPPNLFDNFFNLIREIGHGTNRVGYTVGFQFVSLFKIRKMILAVACMLPHSVNDRSAQSPEFCKLRINGVDYFFKSCLVVAF